MTSELNSGTLPEEELQKQSEVERKKRKRKDYAWAYAMIGPTILGLIILNIYPLLKSFYLSFTKSNGFGISTWTVTDDWPDPVPVTQAEIEVFERWFGDLFDELFGASDS